MWIYSRKETAVHDANTGNGAGMPLDWRVTTESGLSAGKNQVNRIAD